MKNKSKVIMLSLTGVAIVFGSYIAGYYRAAITYTNAASQESVMLNALYLSMLADKQNTSAIQQKSLYWMEDSIKWLTSYDKGHTQSFGPKWLFENALMGKPIVTDESLHDNAEALSEFIKEHPEIQPQQSTLNFFNAYKTVDNK